METRCVPRVRCRGASGAAAPSDTPGRAARRRRMAPPPQSRRGDGEGTARPRRAGDTAAATGSGRARHRRSGAPRRRGTTEYAPGPGTRKVFSPAPGQVPPIFTPVDGGRAAPCALYGFTAPILPPSVGIAEGATPRPPASRAGGKESRRSIFPFVCARSHGDLPRIPGTFARRGLRVSSPIVYGWKGVDRVAGRDHLFLQPGQTTGHGIVHPGVWCPARHRERRRSPEPGFADPSRSPCV
jgi:hypothetical protein